MTDLLAVPTANETAPAVALAAPAAPAEPATGSDVFFQDSWQLYFHDPSDDCWDFMTSYKPLCTISSVNDFLEMHAAFRQLWSKGMFFLSRAHVQPVWEDAIHSRGGCLSFKTMKPEVPAVWWELTARLVGETLASAGAERVTTLSISPKRSYCILRIWVADDTMQSPELYNIRVPSYSSLLYKSHVEAEGNRIGERSHAHAHANERERERS